MLPSLVNVSAITISAEGLENAASTDSSTILPALVNPKCLNLMFVKT